MSEQQLPIYTDPLLHEAWTVAVAASELDDSNARLAAIRVIAARSVGHRPYARDVLVVLGYFR